MCPLLAFPWSRAAAPASGTEAEQNLLRLTPSVRGAKNEFDGDNFQARASHDQCERKRQDYGGRTEEDIRPASKNHADLKTPGNIGEASGWKRQLVRQRSTQPASREDAVRIRRERGISVPCVSRCERYYALTGPLPCVADVAFTELEAYHACPPYMLAQSQPPSQAGCRRLVDSYPPQLGHHHLTRERSKVRQTRTRINRTAILVHAIIFSITRLR